MTIENPIIYVLNTDLFYDDELFMKAYEKVSERRKMKVSRLKQNKDKRLSLGAGILLYYASLKYGFSLSEITYGENGKPYIPGSDVNFSISHSENIAVLAVATFEVGCDIERILSPDLKIAKRFFTNEEYYDIISSDEKNVDFYRFWTLKESYLKATGSGLKTPLDSFRISLKDGIKISGNPEYSLNDFDDVSGFRLAICGKGPTNDTELYFMSADCIKEVL